MTEAQMQAKLAGIGSEMVRVLEKDSDEFLAAHFVKQIILKTTFTKWTDLISAAIRLPKGLDLTDDSMDPVLEKLADDMIRLQPDLAKFIEIDLEICKDAMNKSNVGMLTALKMARSKLVIRSLKEPVHVTMVVPVYKEGNRILNRRDHSSGEDFVNRKRRQIKWLEVPESDIFTWDYIYVDDGCPNGSGGLVQGIVDKEGYTGHQVIYLQKAIDDKDGKFHEKIKDAKSESRKGGAVMYGLFHGNKTRRKDRRHIFGFTDSDLSTHMGQTGLLVDPIVNAGAVFSAGARYINGGVYCSAFAPSVTYNLEEQSTRQESAGDWVHLCNMWSRIYFRDHLLPPFKAANCVDTQCGFKALDGSIMDETVASVTDYWSTIDIELILFAAIKGKTSFVPVVWSESMAESNFWGSGSTYAGYFEMNTTMQKLQAKYKEAKMFAEELPEETALWNTLVEKMTIEQYETMIKKIEASTKLQKSLLLTYAPSVKELAALAGIEL